MKYIQKVVLKNFQSHKDSTIEFDRGLNIIVGASDSGKTSILRGIKWALYNDPAGDYFIREGESESSVTVFFSDSTKIKRYRSKNKNAYFVYNQDGDESKYEGFGTSVPDEVSNVTGIKKILLDKDTSKSINISDQLEGAFLLSEKNSTKANSIGYLVGVDIIDDTLRDTLRDSRNLTYQQRNIDEDVKKLKEELSEYEYLEELNLKMKKIEKINEDINNKTKDLNIYKKILDSKLAIDGEKYQLNNNLEELKHVVQVEIHIKDFQLKYNRLKSILNNKHNLEKTESNKKENLYIVSSLKNINQLDLNLTLLNSWQNKQTKLNKLNIKLGKHIKEKKETNDKLNKLNVLNKIIPSIAIIESNILEFRVLDKLKSRENKVSKSLRKGNDYIKKLINVSLSEEKHKTLNKKISRLDKFDKLHINYLDTKERLNKSDEYLKENKEDIEALSDKYRQVLLSQKTCPLCFSKIDNDKAEYIINQYK